MAVENGQGNSHHAGDVGRPDVPERSTRGVSLGSGVSGEGNEMGVSPAPVKPLFEGSSTPTHPAVAKNRFTTPSGEDTGVSKKSQENGGERGKLAPRRESFGFQAPDASPDETQSLAALVRGFHTKGMELKQIGERFGISTSEARRLLNGTESTPDSGGNGSSSTREQERKTKADGDVEVIGGRRYIRRMDELGVLVLEPENKAKADEEARKQEERARQEEKVRTSMFPHVPEIGEVDVAESGLDFFDGNQQRKTQIIFDEMRGKKMLVYVDPRGPFSGSKSDAEDNGFFQVGIQSPRSEDEEGIDMTTYPEGLSDRTNGRFMYFVDADALVHNADNVSMSDPEDPEQPRRFVVGKVPPESIRYALDIGAQDTVDWIYKNPKATGFKYEHHRK